MSYVYLVDLVLSTFTEAREKKSLEEGVDKEVSNTPLVTTEISTGKFHVV